MDFLFTESTCTKPHCPDILYHEAIKLILSCLLLFRWAHIYSHLLKHTKSFKCLKKTDSTKMFLKNEKDARTVFGWAIWPMSLCLNYCTILVVYISDSTKIDHCYSKPRKYTIKVVFSFTWAVFFFM